jgi:AraC-like DNA-binding protein
MHGANNLLHKSPKMKMTGGGFYEAAKGKNFPPHSHRGWELVYYQSGFITCVHADETFRGEPGLLWLTPPGVTHGELAVTAYRNIYFQLLAPPTSPWPRYVLDDERQNLRRLCTELVLEHSFAGDSHLVLMLLEELFARIARAAQRKEQRPSFEVVRRAEVVMASSLNLRPKIHQIARDVDVSVSGLRSAFQQERGKSPLRVLQEMRRERAISLLQNTTYKLHVLAELCGYDSPSHLSRDVKNASGRSPGRFRR